VLKAPRFYPSSKQCSSCGAVKSKLSLAERTYRCDVRLLVSDRDINAAINLAAWGEHQLSNSASADNPGSDLHLVGRHACGGEVSEVSGSVFPAEAGTSQPLVAQNWIAADRGELRDRGHHTPIAEGGRAAANNATMVARMAALTHDPSQQTALLGPCDASWPS